jgi:hypothetical protein
MDLAAPNSPSGPIYPLKADSTSRYLVDQLDNPFLLLGTPRHLSTNLSLEPTEAFPANRQRYGINALWVDLLCIFTDAGCVQEANVRWHPGFSASRRLYTKPCVFSACRRYVSTMLSGAAGRLCGSSHTATGKRMGSQSGHTRSICRSSLVRQMLDRTFQQVTNMRIR